SEPRLRPAHRTVEEEAVLVADVDAEQLALELGTEGGPIALEDVAEVVVIAPVRGDLVIDDAAGLVEDATRIAVGAERREDRLPDVELLARARVIAEHELELVVLRHRRERVSEAVAAGDARRPPLRTFGIEGVGVAVEVGRDVGAEVD